MSDSDWISRLIPQRIDRSLRSPTDSFVRYLRVVWTAAAVETVDLSARIGGGRRTGRHFERVLESSAAVSGTEVARLTMVLTHTESDDGAHGVTGLVPPRIHRSSTCLQTAGPSR